MRGQWWIPVIAIVLGTGLAIGIDRLSGTHHTNDVKLNLSQQSTTTEDTSSTLLDDSTTLDTSTSLPNLSADALANTPAAPASHSSGHTAGTHTATTRVHNGGGGKGDNTGTTTATTAPSGPNTTQAPPDCSQYKGEADIYEKCLEATGQAPAGGHTSSTDKPKKTSTSTPDTSGD